MGSSASTLRIGILPHVKEYGLNLLQHAGNIRDHGLSEPEKWHAASDGWFGDIQSFESGK